MKTKSEIRSWRKKRIRKKVSGSAERPRLSVFRSASHIYAQVIDDDARHTLLSVIGISGSAEAGPEESLATPLTGRSSPNV